VITDLDQAEQAIRTVVGMAERAAGLTVQSVVVNVTAGRLGS
jgi:cell division protein FtsA